LRRMSSKALAQEDKVITLSRFSNLELRMARHLFSSFDLSFEARKT